MGLKIKRFKLKEGRSVPDDVIQYSFRKGGSWIHKDAAAFVSKVLSKADKRYGDYEISFNMCFRKNPEEFNDFDNVLILDEEFCQPYTPFYAYLNEEAEEFPFLAWVISEYNEWMSSFDFLEEVKE